jgi:GGDEF domain-containing protein
MREEWAGCEFEFGGNAVSITASFGLAGFCGKEAPAFQTLVQRADKALYAAKRSGGNHVKIAKDENSDA